MAGWLALPDAAAWGDHDDLRGRWAWNALGTSPRRALVVTLGFRILW
ncbi:MAG: hypothetical protein ACRDQI_01070 [Pseudonocardiaceae bacterium]